MKEVSRALDMELNAAGSGMAVMKLLATAQSRAEIEKGMEEMTDGKRDFVLFAAGSHSRWLEAYFNGSRSFPETQVYTIGNPLLAQTMLQIDLVAGLHIPPKFVVQAKNNGEGTVIIYDLPSSCIDIKENVELRKAAVVLDEKLEKLARKVLS